MIGSHHGRAYLRGDNQLTLASHLHTKDPLVPSTDYLPFTDLKVKWSTPARAVELLAVALQPPCVMDQHRVACVSAQPTRMSHREGRERQDLYNWPDERKEGGVVPHRRRGCRRRPQSDQDIAIPRQ